MNPVYTAAEVSKQLKISKARFVITTADHIPRLEEAASKLGLTLGSELTVLIVGGENCKVLLKSFVRKFKQ